MASDSLNSKLDALLWNPAATASALDSACAFAVAHQLRAVCVNSSRVVTTAARLEDTGVKTVALVGFPLGAMDADAKRYEAELALDLGAQEVEVVISLGQIKDGAAARLLRELRDLVAVADGNSVATILEIAQLSPVELKWVGEVIQESGVHRITTSTDFWPDARVTPEHLQSLQELVGGKVQLKSVGGIRDPQLAAALLAAGATLIGSTSAAALVSPVAPGN